VWLRSCARLSSIVDGTEVVVKLLTASSWRVASVEMAVQIMLVIINYVFSSVVCYLCQEPNSYRDPPIMILVEKNGKKIMN